MKKTNRIITVALIAIALTGMSLTDDKQKNSAAVAEQVNGLYIFMYSKPAGEINFLGTVKALITLTGSTEEVVNKLCKKARKEYPNAQGIVINMTNFDKADVINFK